MPTVLFVWMAAAGAAETGGFAEIRGSWQVGVDGTPWMLVERVRPDFEAELSERVLLAATPELSLRQGRDVQEELQQAFRASEDFAALFDLLECTWPPADDDVFLNNDTAGAYLSVERFYLDAYLPQADVRIGRQAIDWGSALWLNPTDPFPEVLFLEPWRQRRGVNAARATVPFAERHHVTAVVGTDDTFRWPRLAGRTTFTFGSTDLSAIGAWRDEVKTGIVGVDLRGNLEVGWWLEGSLHLGKDVDPYEELAVGLDYSFPVLERLVVSGQYYRNGGGADDPRDYDLAGRASADIEPPTCAVADDTSEFFAQTQRTDPFAPFLLGTDYALAQVTLMATTELSFSAVGLQNVRDGTGVAVPVVTVRPTGALEVSATAQVPYRIWGDGGEFKPNEYQTTYRVPGANGYYDADLSGLVPAATFTVYTRANF